MEPILLIGLGNPGDEYALTRHNIGFRVIDALGRTRKVRTVRPAGEYALLATREGERLILLMKPLTYMNNSGTAVADVIERHALSAEQMLVIVDDFALPLGKLRLRRSGSDGGHNGLFSIAHALQTTQFARLRCGIGVPEMPAKRLLADFVLSPFSAEEIPAADRMVTEAAKMALAFARGGPPEAARRRSL